MKLSIMSSNIWGDYFGNEIPPRALQLSAIYHRYQPDILGLQEMTPNYYKSLLLSDLSDLYTLVPVQTHEQVNYTPLLYKTARFDLGDCGWERFVQTPDETKSLTWGLLSARQSEQRVVAVSLHFWWKNGPEHDVIRYKNAVQLCAKMRELEAKFDCPVFAFGDFNCGTNSKPMSYLTKQGLPTVQLCAADYRDDISSQGEVSAR